MSPVDTPLIWPREKPCPHADTSPRDTVVANADLVHDQDAISQFFPKVKRCNQRNSAFIGGWYKAGRWSDQEVVVLRDTDAGVCSVTSQSKASYGAGDEGSRQKHFLQRTRCVDQLSAPATRSWWRNCLTKEKGRLWMFCRRLSIRALAGVWSARKALIVDAHMP